MEGCLWHLKPLRNYLGTQKAKSVSIVFSVAGFGGAGSGRLVHAQSRPFSFELLVRPLYK